MSFQYSVFSIQFSEFEIVFRVVVADILYHLLYAGFLVTCVRDHTVLDIITEDVAQRAAEVLVTRIAEERAAIMVKQRRGLHSKKVDKGIFIYATLTKL